MSGFDADERDGHFSPIAVWDADHGSLENCRVGVEHLLDLARIDVLAAAYDHVPEAPLHAAITMLVQAPEIAGMVSSWRLVTLGGAPVPPELVRSAQRRGLKVAIGFGQTEASPYLTHTLPDDPHPDWVS